MHVIVGKIQHTPGAADPGATGYVASALSVAASRSTSSSVL